MRMLNELAEYPLMKRVRGSDTTDDEQVQSSLKPPMHPVLIMQFAMMAEPSDDLLEL